MSQDDDGFDYIVKIIDKSDKVIIIIYMCIFGKRFSFIK